LNILVIHEIDWEKKVIFEPHHLAELLSLNHHNVYVIDCQEPDLKNLINGLKTNVIKNYHRIYPNASITLIRPPSLLIKGLNRLTYFFNCKRIIKETIIKNKIDVILLYSVATSGIQTIEIANELKIPTIFRVLDVAHGFVNFPFIRQLVKKYEQQVIQNSTLVLPIIPNLLSYALEMGASQKTTEVFPLGINTKIFKPLSKNNDLSKKLRIHDEKVIMFVGTLFPFSGLSSIISNFNIILQKEKNIKLVIIGGGANFNHLSSLIQKNNLESYVILTGFIPQHEIPSYLSLANICIQPFETNYLTNCILPSKILEYFACKKPVLSTPLKGTKEYLPNEDYGIVYATSNEFVEKLSELIVDEKYLEELGENGYSYVTKNHDWDLLVNLLMAKFEQLLSNKL
jgi:glycosyltransferase involved in cell wall biosynthesis